MKVRGHGDPQVGKPSKFAAGDGAPSDLAMIKSWDASVKTSTTKAKLLQSRSGFGLLVEIAGQCVHFLGDLVEPLSFMERTTSEVLRECINRNSCLSTFSKEYVMQTRVHCTDKGSSNLRAERSIAQQRHGGWFTVGTTCSLHACSTCHTRTFQYLLADDIAGMIRTALSLQNGAAMACFRSCLRLEIKERLVVTTGSISKDAHDYKELCMSTFASGSTLQDDLQRHVLKRLATGDWRDEVAVQFVIVPGQAHQSKEELSQLLESGLTWVMAGCRPRLYPRHRWTGAEICVDQLAKVEMVHKLLSKSFKRFVLSFAKPSLLLAGSIPDNSQQGTVDMSEDVVEHTACHEPFAGEALNASVTEAPFQTADCIEPPPAESNSNDKSAAEHSQDRQIALAWIEKRPWSKLVALRVALGPLTKLMNAQFYVCSEAFELTQRATVAAAVLRGEKGCGLREFMITLAAELKLEKQYYNDLHHVFTDHKVWAIVGKESVSVAFRSMLFKLLARQGSLVQQLVVAMHKRYPYRLFLLLRHPEMRQHLLSDAPCLLDPWSAEVRRLHPTLDSDEFYSLLAVHAYAISTNIAPLEARHASIRRLLIQRVQVIPMDVSLCSALWVCQNLRALKHGSVTSTSVKPGQKVKSTRRLRVKEAERGLRGVLHEVTKAKQRQHVGGGAWRAWTHTHLWGRQGQKPCLKSAAAAFRDAKTQDTLEYQQAVALGKRARAATKANVRSGSSFGPSSRDVKRGAEREVQKALFEQLQGMPEVEQATLLAKRLSLTGNSLQDVLGMARGLNRMGAQAAKKKTADELNVIQEFENTIGKSQLHSVLAALPDMGFEHFLQPLPSGLGPAFVVKHQGQQSLATALDWVTATNKSNIPAALARHWSDRHIPVLHSHCPPISEAPELLNKCCSVGVCLCSVHGRRLSQVRSRLLQAMKKRFVGQELKQQLTSGNVVVQLVAGSHEDLWLHISSLYLSPYKASMLLMQKEPEPSLLTCGEEPSASRVLLKAMAG
eukprot:2347774-Amphidinium_carterae.1